jgi:hypothetical protein
MTKDRVLLQCISVLDHIYRQLAQIKRDIDDPLKVIDLTNTALFTLFHEQKAFIGLTFQPSPDLQECIKTIDDTLRMLIKLRDYAATSGFDEPYTMTKAIEQKISLCLKHVCEGLHDVAEGEHGQPMAISIPPYRPWDAVEPPVSVLPRLIAESLRPKLTMAVKLFSGSPKDKKE